MAIAGKVAITPGYKWYVDVAYDKLVVVTFGNDVYLSTKPSTGIEPTNEEYWMLLIENVTAEDVEELQTTVQNILNGTTTVGKAKDADTVDGYHASDFVTTSGGNESTEVSRTNGVPIVVSNTTSGAKTSVIGFKNPTDGVMGHLGFTNKDVPNFISADKSKVNTLLHTGNKPSGSYTGNGDETERTINVGGIGNVLLISRAQFGMVFVFENYCYIIKADGTITQSQEATFSDGVLTIKSKGNYLNANSGRFPYSVL